MDIEATVSCLNVLGGLLYLPPDDESLTPVFKVFSDPYWTSSWPCGDKEALSAIHELISGQPHEPQDLKEAHGELFVGKEPLSGHLKAPPWGSVYTDAQREMFGQSTQKLRAFLGEQGLEIKRNNDEPEDHIGLLLLTAAWLGVARREKALSSLLQDHVLPWAPTYFSLLKAASPHPFYQGIADLAALTLDTLRRERNLEVMELNLHQ